MHSSHTQTLGKMFGPNCGPRTAKASHNLLLSENQKQHLEMTGWAGQMANEKAQSSRPDDGVGSTDFQS